MEVDCIVGGTVDVKLRPILNCFALKFGHGLRIVEKSKLKH